MKLPTVAMWERSVMSLCPYIILGDLETAMNLSPLRRSQLGEGAWAER